MFAVNSWRPLEGCVSELLEHFSSWVMMKEAFSNECE